MLSKNDREILKKFGENLKKIRESKGYTVRTLSHQCNIDFSDISKIEKGLKNITFKTMLDLARGLEIAPKRLLEFEAEWL